ncbi:MAG: glycosyltransferase [Chthoniobacterales bacterium]
MFKKNKSIATVAINLRPRRGSWGGANQWVSQLTRWLKYTGHRVRFDLRGTPDCIVMTHTGLAAATEFGADEIEAFRKKMPSGSPVSRVPCIHRINDNDIRKETNEMDAFLDKSGRVADHTVFVSEWLRDYHSNKWFDSNNSHSVIMPGADGRFFNPIGNQIWSADKKLILVTHHWSDNWNKGFDIYRDIDELLSGPLGEKFALCIIGRWPKEITWKNAKTIPPASGADLANHLRSCHAYISASRFEPGAMHVVEGLQCGLPLLYHPDTGGTVEWGRRVGMELSSNLAESLEKFADAYYDLRKKLLASPPSGAAMAASYTNIIQSLIVKNREAFT